MLLFSVWKITFRILDADNNEIPLFEMVKEIVKCVFLIFGIYLIFNTSINIGINLSNSIYNSFNSTESTIGDKMKSSYMTINESCYATNGGENVDSKNVIDLKEYLNGYANVDNVTTIEDFEELIRNDTISASDISDSGAFSYRCNIYKPGIWNDKEDYAFSYNFFFGIIIGIIFLFSIGFAVLMLGRRQLELAFLMTISPLVIATSVGRKEQRSALYQQLASLILQSGAMMLLIGLTTIMFNVIQNSSDINNLSYFTKVVTQSILYLGCAMLLMTGCTSLNRFIGDNVSANSGRDIMLAMGGLLGGIRTAGSIGTGLLGTVKNTTFDSLKTGKGISQIAKGGVQTTKGMYHRLASDNDKTHSAISNKMNEEMGKGISNVAKGTFMQQSSNPLSRTYGKMLETRGENQMKNVASKWNFAEDKYNDDYLKSGINLAQKGISNVKDGVGGTLNNIKNIGNANNINYRKKPSINRYIDSDNK